MVRQILLQIIFVIHLQDLPHFINGDLRQFNLPHDRVLQAHREGDIFGRIAQGGSHGLQVFGQKFR